MKERDEGKRRENERERGGERRGKKEGKREREGKTMPATFQRFQPISVCVKI